MAMMRPKYGWIINNMAVGQAPLYIQQMTKLVLLGCEQPTHLLAG